MIYTAHNAPNNKQQTQQSTQNINYSSIHHIKLIYYNVHLDMIQ